VTSDVWFALLLSALAGLSTTIGSVLALFVRKPNPRLMTLTLGFSGGVMILISFVELLPNGIEAIGFGPANLVFFAGMTAMFLIDELIPHDYMGENHHTGAGNEHPPFTTSRRGWPFRRPSTRRLGVGARRSGGRFSSAWLNRRGHCWQRLS
jgi:zinc transporter ZupT